MASKKIITEKRKRQCAKLCDLSKEVIRKAFDKFNADQIGITWSGGKDSSLNLWLIKEVCEERSISIPKTIFIEEGDEFEEIKEFVDRYGKVWKVPLDVCRNDDVLRAADHKLGAPVMVRTLCKRNQEELERIGFQDEEFPFEPEGYAGNHLMKTVVFNQWLERNNIKAVFQGLRWDEHPARFDDTYFEKMDRQYLIPEHTRIKPILHFTEKDLWDSYAAFNIPHCVLYEQGYRSLGAKTTSLKSSDLPAWEQDIEGGEERADRSQGKEQAMKRLRLLGYM